MKQIRTIIYEFRKKHKLTKREFEVLLCLINGTTTTKDLSKKLGVSPFTIKNHLDNILQKTDLSSKTEIFQRILFECLGQKLHTSDFPSDVPVILLVEDEPAMRSLMKDIIGKLKCEIHEAGTADEALAKFTAFPFYDVIITDVRMPGEKDGLCLLKEIKAASIRPHVLVTTAYGEGLEADVYDLGASDLLKKPFEGEQLIDALKRVLQNNHRYGDVLPGDELPLTLAFAYTSEDDLVEGQRVRVGRGGLSGVTEQQCKMGDIVGCELVCSQHKHVFTAVSEVSWVHELSDQKRALGLKFLNMSPENEAWLERFLEQHAIVAYIPKFTQ